MNRSVYAREPLKPPDIGIECPACHGRMEHAQMPCTIKEHGVNCSRVHFGYRCNSCGGYLDENKVLKREQKEQWRRNLSTNT